MPKKTEAKTEDGFLTRWSVKKSQTDQHLAPKEEVTGNDQQDAQRHYPEAPVSEEPVLTDEDMPDIASLDEKSDFSGFLSPGVSDELRKLALRKLFASKMFNVTDGLDDYDDDFRSFAALGDIITSDMKHQQELAEEKQRQEEDEKLEQQKLDEEQEHAAQDSNDDKAADQGADDQHAYHQNSKSRDQSQKNEASAMHAENKPESRSG